MVISVVNGFERELRERLLAVLPQLTAEPYQGLGADEVERLLQQPLLPGIEGIAPFVAGTSLLSAGEKVSGASLVGIDHHFDTVSQMSRYLQGGRLDVLAENKYGIVLGAGIARQLNVDIGDQVLVILPSGTVTPAGATPRQRHFTVVDLLRSDSQLDSQSAYLPLATAQRLFRTGGRVQGVYARLTDLFAVSRGQEALYQMLEHRPGLRVRSWMGTYGPLYEAIAVQKLTMFVLLSFLVAVAAFNLVSGLVMIVEQRKQDVAVLRSLGASGGLVVAVFCVLGVGLGAAGVGLGLLAGVAIAYALPVIFSAMTETFGLELMSQYFIAYLPVDVRSLDILGVGGTALVLALLATLYPAWRAAKLLPSRVLAYE